MTLTVASPPPTYSPTASTHWDEERYQQWLCQRQLPVALKTLGFVAFAIVVFGGWDIWLSSVKTAATYVWPIRAIALFVVFVSLILLRFTEAARHWRVISFVSSCLLFSLLLVILGRLDEHTPLQPGAFPFSDRGVILGAGGLLLSAFLLRVHSPRMAVSAAVFNLVAAPIVFLLFGVGKDIIINSEIFLLIASVGNITLNLSDDQSDRQKFELEWHLERMATTDGLTGASNRRFFAQKMDQEIERAQRYGYPLAVILLDIDHFKKVNDTRGHGDGDEALKSLATIGIESGRGSDLFARLGGEEFVMLLPHTEIDSAMALAERLRTQIELHKIRGESGEFSVTSSLGVAALKKVDNADAFLARADAALYLAKNQGRNRVKSQLDLMAS